MKLFFVLLFGFITQSGICSYCDDGWFTCTPTKTGTLTPTNTPTPRWTATPTKTGTPTRTPTNTRTNTPTNTVTKTATIPPAGTNTPTVGPTKVIGVINPANPKNVYDSTTAGMFTGSNVLGFGQSFYTEGNGFGLWENTIGWDFNDGAEFFEMNPISSTVTLYDPYGGINLTSGGQPISITSPNIVINSVPCVASYSVTFLNAALTPTTLTFNNGLLVATNP